MDNKNVILVVGMTLVLLFNVGEKLYIIYVPQKGLIGIFIFCNYIWYILVLFMVFYYFFLM